MEFKAYETSSAQRRVYIIHQLGRNSVFYNMPCAKIVEGNLEADHLERAIKKLIQRHETLRTCFIVKNGKILQQVYDSSDFKLKCTTFPQVEINQLTQNFIQPFDLDKVPLWRAELVQLQSDRHLFLFDIHHIISDGVSINLIFNEIMVFYQGNTLPPLEFQYVDFTIWQNDIFNSGKIKHQEEYWLNVFQGEIPVLNMPTDFPRPLEIDTAGASIEFEIGKDLTGRLKAAAARNKTTLYIVMLAAYNILLSKYTSQEYIIVGTPTAGRPQPQLEKIVGMFVNTLAMRNRPTPEKSIKEFLEEVSSNAISAFENQDYPFEMLVEKLNVERQLNRNPLFDTMFSLQNYSQKIQTFWGNNKKLKFVPYPIKQEVAKFDLSLNTFELDQRLTISIEYRTSLFKKDTIDRLTKHFINILQTVTENPLIKMPEIQILTSEEKEYLSYFLNNTDAEYPKDKTLHELFGEQVKRTPDRTALVAKEEGWKSKRVEGKKEEVPIRQVLSTFPVGHLSYKELNESANQLSHRVQGKGVKPETIVGIMVNRSFEMMIGILGILKAGGAYMPIAPDYPEKRIKYMLEDAKVKILVKKSNIFRDSPIGKVIDVISIDDPAVFSSSPQVHTHRQPAPPACLAYAIYTSGSTGKPKGVTVEHRSAVNTLHALHNKYPFRESDTYLLKTSYIFDVSLTELFGWFLGGGRLSVLEKNGEKEPGKILNAIIMTSVTHINFVPSMFAVFVDMLFTYAVEGLNSLKYIFLAGEALSPGVISKFKEINTTVSLENIYGPTEATIYASQYSLSEWQGRGNIPIGKPLPNIKLHILNKYNHLQPIGVPGELCISGVGLARGYLNQPQLTAEKFNHDLWDYQDYHDKKDKSFLWDPGGRFFKKTPLAARGKLYKTGDLARWLPDGNIEFLGRIDHQVKIRGFRIELGEIESQLGKHPGIKEAVVICRENEGGDKYICAYIVSEKSNEEPLDTMELGTHLSRTLPPYMIPSYFVQLEKIPLFSNGKVARKELPIPEIKSWEEYHAPGNEVEEKLVEIWADVLGTKKNRISIDANFFQLGGHSLKATILIGKIHKVLNVNIPMEEIFKTPTIREIAVFITKVEKTIFIDPDKIEGREFYELSYNQKRLWLLNQLQPESPSYNLCGGIELKHKVDAHMIKEALYKIIERHESLRTGLKIVNAEPVQYVRKEVKIPFKNINISFMEETQKKKKADQIYKSEQKTPFDLYEIPLFRTLLLKLHETHYNFIFNMHHIITDGWSIEILKKEFLLYYDGLRKGKEYKLVPLKFQYKDFAAWSNKQLAVPLSDQQSHRFWKEKLRNGISPLHLPINPRGNRKDNRGAGYRCVLGKETKDRLKSLRGDYRTTLFMTMFSLYLILLSRLSKQEEVVCSVIAAGRDHPSLQNVVGFFVNSILFKTTVKHEESFTDFLKRVNNEMVEIFQHQGYPLEPVFKELKMKYPDVPVSFNMLNMQDETTHLEIDRFEPQHFENVQDVKFDIEIYITEYKNAILLYWVYKKLLFSPAKIEYIAREYNKLIEFFRNNLYKSAAEYKNKNKKRVFKRNDSEIRGTVYVD